MIITILNTTLFPATRPETTKIKNDIKDTWLIKFAYEEDGMTLRGEIYTETNVPLKYHHPVARGVVIERLKNMMLF